MNCGNEERVSYLSHKEIPSSEADSSRCRFGCQDTAVGVFILPAGCICFPDDKEQILCLHHAMRSTDYDGIWIKNLVTDLPEFERGILARRYVFG